MKERPPRDYADEFDDLSIPMQRGETRGFTIVETRRRPWVLVAVGLLAGMGIVAGLYGISVLVR